MTPHMAKRRALALRALLLRLGAPNVVAFPLVARAEAVARERQAQRRAGRRAGKPLRSAP